MTISYILTIISLSITISYTESLNLQNGVSFFTTFLRFLRNQQIFGTKNYRSINHILKECFISKDLQIIRKKEQAPFMLVVPLKILKRYCNAFALQLY